ncbi:signal peptide-containing protein [Theileria equi strain WA]|uniref:Signal peptide-containing protein n=1 Tax=Theileria equi strain WA TaxID=1537102 RepID=L0AVY7_THEEQ|nr:signal peptide-containing protein [Theileria equi strain WA]AFZ79715.1 signal peptide-containing protein [Theileria equi strain WA]|eukprot:XP_004829381.1 signal peptide-containing protein [Theileria equi strain WA]
MKFLAVLWTVCLVGLCSASCCGGDVTDGDTLDLLNPDESKVDVGEETSHGIRWKVLTPKGNANFKSFTEGRVDVGTTTEKFKYAKISLDPRAPLVEIAHGGVRYKLNHYEKSGGKWKETDYSEFDKKVNAIKKNVVKPETAPEAKQEQQSANADGTSNNPED